MIDRDFGVVRSNPVQLHDCPRHIPTSDGKTRAVRCKRWDCPICGNIKLSDLIDSSKLMSAPITANFRADDPTKLRIFWKRCRMRLREMTYLAVTQTDDTGLHMHAVLDGVLPHVFRAAAEAAGLSNVFAEQALDVAAHVAYIARLRMQPSTRFSHSRIFTRKETDENRQTRPEVQPPEEGTIEENIARADAVSRQAAQATAQEEAPSSRSAAPQTFPVVATYDGGSVHHYHSLIEAARAAAIAAQASVTVTFTFNPERTP